MMKAHSIAAAAALALTACATTAPVREVQLSQPYDHEATMRQLAPGVGTVKMNAFMRQRGGGVVTCAGRRVYLYPSTPYSEERARANYGPFQTSAYGPFVRTNFAPASPQYEAAMREQTCDSQGNAVFDKVGPGAWLLITSVYWEAGGINQGGFLIGRLQVSADETKSIVLAH